jgi:hypothetical protein
MFRILRILGNMFRPIDRPLFTARLEGERRSLRLLESNLTPAQGRQFASHDYFDVIGGDTGTRYRIYHGRVLNVGQLHADGARERMLCFEPEGALPTGDIMLAQKMALELFESDALRVAHSSPTWLLGVGRGGGQLTRGRH